MPIQSVGTHTMGTAQTVISESYETKIDQLASRAVDDEDDIARKKIMDKWFKAAYKGNLCKQKTILRRAGRVVNVNTEAEPGGYTALLLSTENAQLEAVKWLLEQGADVWLRSDTGELPSDRLVRAQFCHKDNALAIAHLLKQKQHQIPEPEKAQIEEIVQKVQNLAEQRAPYTTEDRATIRNVMKQAHSLKVQNVAKRLNLINNACFRYQILGQTIGYRHPELLAALMHLPGTDPSGGEDCNTLVAACRATAPHCLKLLLDSEKVDPSGWGRGNPISNIVYPLQEAVEKIWLAARKGSLTQEQILTARIFVNHPRVPEEVLRRDYYGTTPLDVVASLVGRKISSQEKFDDQKVRVIFNRCLDELELYRTSPEHAIVQRLYGLSMNPMNDAEVEEARELIVELKLLQPERASDLLEPTFPGSVQFMGDIRISAKHLNPALLEMLDALKR